MSKFVTFSEMADEWDDEVSIFFFYIFRAFSLAWHSVLRVEKDSFFLLSLHSFIFNLSNIGTGCQAHEYQKNYQQQR